MPGAPFSAAVALLTPDDLTAATLPQTYTRRMATLLSLLGPGLPMLGPSLKVDALLTPCFLQMLLAIRPIICKLFLRLFACFHLQSTVVKPSLSTQHLPPFVGTFLTHHLLACSQRTHACSAPGSFYRWHWHWTARGRALPWDLLFHVWATSRQQHSQTHL